ncbi:MAG: hypothetical protein QF552_02785 [Litorilituus sp.]|nr:hypothetical protein [Litorilituus sp.]
MIRISIGEITPIITFISGDKVDKHPSFPELGLLEHHQYSLAQSH